MVRSFEKYARICILDYANMSSLCYRSRKSRIRSVISLTFLILSPKRKRTFPLMIRSRVNVVSRKPCGRVKYIYFLKAAANMEQMFRLEYTLSATFYDGSHTCGYFHSLFRGTISSFEKRNRGHIYLHTTW